MRIQRWGVVAVSMVSSALMACTHTPVGYRVPGAEKRSVAVVTAHDAAKLELPAWSLKMPLQEEEDASVLKFLEQAEASGAKYLTDVDRVFAAESNGQPLECRTHFLPVVAVENQQPGAPRYYVRRRVMEEVAMSYGPGCAPEQRSAGDGKNCTAVPVVRQSQPPAPLYVSEVVRADDAAPVKRWRLLKTDPECTPLAAGAQATVAERIEARAYGCDGAASGCQDKTR
ncbi:hypothetical protein [Archangium sp.]|uniref:hypothetical protein n=1 Tax=Archangium sp. TaxID=1872627 RepID=UPI00286B0259|nr:hypothetical protein [Archangium sp.]